MDNQSKRQRVGLVLEGGSMRGLYTAGVLDTFMDENIKIDGFVGVSAGAIFGVNYFSKQRGRVIRYNKAFCRDSRYMSLKSLLTTGNMINRKFAFYDVTTMYDIFDNETFMKNNTGYAAAATNVETGEAEYIEVTNVLEELELLRATSAIPFVSQIVDFKGKKYLDGGIGDSIPIRKGMELGYDKIIVVLTRPLDYRKKPYSRGIMWAIKMKYKKYPRLIEAIANRHNVYNDTIDLIRDLEEKGKIFVMRPSQKLDVGVIERDADKLQAVYDLGRNDCNSRMEDLKEYLK